MYLAFAQRSALSNNSFARGDKEVLHINEGDEVEFTRGRDEKSTVRGGVSVPADQAWFFTRERLAGKREADEEIAMSKGTVHGSGEAMFVHLGNLGAADG